MTNLKRVSRRTLALFLSLVMCMGMLNLTAFAAETDQWTCGLEEHTHTEACYEASQPRVPDSQEEEKAGHTHTEACYLCTLEEGHTHSDSCYTTEESEETEQILICTQSTEGHTHDDSCYERTEVLTCTQEESEGHSHSDSCYSSELTCGQEEGGEGEEAHSHSSGCYTQSLACGQEESEGHSHSDGCYEQQENLTCTQEETEAHEHSEACYETVTKTQRVLSCTEEETGHRHGDGSCVLELVCDAETSQADQSRDSQEESAPEPAEEENSEAAELVRTCGKEEHSHTYACSQCAVAFVEGVEALKADVDQWCADCDAGTKDAETLNTECETLRAEAGRLSALLDSMFSQVGNSSEVRSARSELETVCAELNPLETEEAVEVSTLAELNEQMTEGKLNRNVNVTETITIGEPFCLDLNGHTMQFTGETGSVLQITGGTFTLDDSAGGGKITGGKGMPDPHTKHSDYGQCGGGVFVCAGATFVMNGGEITGNEANTGGGIYIDRSIENVPGNFDMYGGSITNNTAKTHEGGGIFCYGVGEINPVHGDIYITSNRTDTTTDLGGGGIHVNMGGVMNIWNAVVTGNTARGMGGGVAGCIHGDISNLAPKTAAIYENTAKRDPGARAENEKVDHGADLLEWTENLKNAAVDYFCAGKTTIASEALGGFTRWTGTVVTKNDEKAVDTNENDPIVVEGALCGLTAEYDGSFSGNTVTIRDNYSNIHGGGIGCNGTLTFGEYRLNPVFGRVSLEAQKTVEGAQEDDQLQKGQFTFRLYDSGKNPISGGTATNDENGKIRFNVKSDKLFGDERGTFEGREFTLYLREDEGGKEGMTYDLTWRKLVLTVSRSSRTSGETTVFTDKITSAALSDEDGNTLGNVVVNENGNVLTLNGEANFVNRMAYYGSLTVKKSVSGPETEEAFTFTVKLGEGTVDAGAGTEYVENGVYTFQLKHDESATITGIPVGVKYTVTEAEAEGYAKTGEVTEGKEIVSGKQTETVINTFIKGQISIAKKLDVDGKEPDAQYLEREFRFQVYEGAAADGKLAETVTVTPRGGAASIGDLPKGVYTIVEVDDTKIDGMEWNGVTYETEDADPEMDGFQVVVGEQDQTCEVVAVNHYMTPDIPTPVKGQISIAKKLDVDGKEPDAQYLEREFRFQVYEGAAADGKLAETVTVTPRGGAASTGDLPKGVYTIVEVGGTEIDGLKWNGVTYGPEDADPEMDGFQVVVDEQNPVCEVAATNHYTTPDDPSDPDDPDDPDEPNTPETPDNPTPSTPTEEEIPEPEVPLSELPETPAIPPEEEIFDEEVPLADAPRTGDGSHTSLWASLCAASFLGLAALLGKKKKTEP